MSDTQHTADESIVDEHPEFTTAQVLAAMKAKYQGSPARIAEQLSQGIVNPMELAKELHIRPQQVYQAIRQGALKAVHQNNTQKLYIDETEAARWAAAVYNRRLKKAQAAREAAMAELEIAAFDAEELAAGDTSPLELEAGPQDTVVEDEPEA